MARRHPKPAFASLADYFTHTGTLQKDFAKRHGVTGATISRYASGKATPRLELATRIAADANVPVASLLRRSA